MARTGSVLLTLLLATSALAEVEFQMTTDQKRVGVEDTFRLIITIGNAPEGASLQLPSSEDFEILGRSESTQMSYSVGLGGAGVIQQVRKHVLTVRANNIGTLMVPPATLRLSNGKAHKTAALTVDVVKGRLKADRPQRSQSLFGLPGIPPGFPFLDDDLPPSISPEEADIPHSESDIFIRSSVDRPEVYMGEQLILSIHVYARVDLSSVDTVTMPKLEGFLAVDLKSPTQLMPHRRVVGGVEYNEYLLRQKALFPLKAGEIAIDAAEADMTSGLLFAGRRTHRKGNALTVKVKTLPSGGKSTLVGQWKLSREVQSAEVTLGDPIQFKLIVEGQGNLQAVPIPKLDVPAGMRAFDPEVSDKANTMRGLIGGQKIIEYVLMPQQTGSFVLPAVSLTYFDPTQKVYAETSVEPLTITVRPASASGSSTRSPVVTTDNQPKNQLQGGAMRPLRVNAQFSAPMRPLWAEWWFVPLTLSAPAAWLVVMVMRFIRMAIHRDDPEARKKRLAQAAKSRLKKIDQLATQGSAQDFYAEVERTLNGFLEAQLGTTVVGLTRQQLEERLAQANVASEVARRILAVYEASDRGRYAPGSVDETSRKQTVADAQAAMEGWS